MNDFEQYLTLHNIDPMVLLVKAKVRYLVIWNAQKGNPIASANAKKIREALFTLTGVPYTGSFVLLDQPLDQLPILPIKKLPRIQYS